MIFIVWWCIEKLQGGGFHEICSQGYITGNWYTYHINGVMQKKYGSSALALDLHFFCINLDSKVHGANMWPIWGRQDPGGPYVGPMNFAICEAIDIMS